MPAKRAVRFAIHSGIARHDQRSRVVRATIGGADHSFCMLLFVLLALAGVVLLSLALRYRVGTARRQARRWVASLNVWMTSFSVIFFLSFTLLLSFWVGSAFRFSLIGMGVGGILGLLGLAVTRWESRPEGLFYTPSRWLAFLIIFAIAARVMHGWWH